MKNSILSFFLLLLTFTCWSQTTVNVIFDIQVQGVGTRTDSPLTGSKLYEPIWNVSNPNYNFSGWYKEPECINKWNFDTDRVYSDITLYAKWTPHNYTLEYYTNGGSTIPMGVCYYDRLLTPPTPPIKNNYIFAGWYKEPECINIWNFNADRTMSATWLYARWIPSSTTIYIVKFDVQGGDAKMMDLIEPTGSTLVSPIAPTKTGFIFEGWYKEAACTNPWNFSSDKVTSHITLYAKWVPNYTVLFDSQGGSAITSITAASGSIITPPVEPTKTGFLFAGWYKETACTNQWNFSTDKLTSNITLYAKWNPASSAMYTVIYDSQGGSAVASHTVAAGTALTSYLVPLKTGFTFAGWYKDAACTNKWNFFSEKVTSNITLYAKWDLNYTVLFDSQGGSDVASIIVPSGSDIPFPTPPAKDGYSFACWYKEAECINQWWNDLDDVMTNITLYAKWIKVYTVQFDSQGGSVVDSKHIMSGLPLNNAPVAPTKDGVTFDGWYKEAECTNPWDFTSDKVTSDLTLYAKWTPAGIVTYTVLFDSQGGSDVDNIIANSGSAIIAPAAPTKAGFTFAGWYKEAECTNPWDFTSDKVISDLILYARWNWTGDEEVLIKFDSNGGSEIPDILVNIGLLINKPMDPTKTGYTFDGWYTDLALSKIWNFATDTVKEEMKLYAKWKLQNNVATLVDEIIKVYPTKTSNQITVEAEKIQGIIIYNNSGALVSNIKYNNLSKVQVSLADVKNGILFIVVQSNTEIKTFKIIKD